ncbi:MAG: aspartate kinase [Pseudobdellovibrionaceae bacterium]
MSKNPKLVVQKYGGATLSDPQKIKAVAARLAELSRQGTQVVAVVSAMGKTTNQLIDLANQVSTRPNRRELDMLLTTGERVSMALVSMALHDLGCHAISFTGSQAGILTDHSHVNAFIEDVKAFRVEESLQAGKVVVLAGFQGVSPKTKEITTLGRGGSDTTAVAMAAYLKAEVCEILKDVPAVFTVDPHLVKEAQILNELNYDQLLDMTFWGAKVLHYRSVELAKRKQITLYIGPASQKSNSGTWVQEGKQMYESAKILAINSHEKVLEIHSPHHSASEAIEKMRQFFDQKEIAFPQILQILPKPPGVCFYLTGPQEILLAIEKELAQSKDFQLGKDVFSSVSATCTGSTSPDVVHQILSALEKKKIPVHTTLQSAMSATVLVAHSQREAAMKELHSLI